jgi:hypothetical protein
MRTVSACWRTLAAGAALAWALAPAVLSAAPAAPAGGDKDKEPTAVEKIRKALDAPVSVKIEKQSLTAAIDMLKEKSKINFSIDAFSIQQMGWLPDQPPTPVDVDLKDVKMKSALRTILSPYSLSYAIVGDTVVVTTEQMAMMRQMKQRVNVEFDKMEFAQALKQLQRETAVNLLLDSRVEKEAKAPVSLELEDVPLETAVRLLSEMAGLKPVRIGNVLFVTTKANANDLRQDPDLSQVQGPQVVPGQDLIIQGGGPGFVGGGIAVAPGGPFAPPIAGGTTPPAVNPPGVPPAVPPAVDEKKPDEAKPKDADPKAGDSKGDNKQQPKDGDK